MFLFVNAVCLRYRRFRRLVSRVFLLMAVNCGFSAFLLAPSNSRGFAFLRRWLPPASLKVLYLLLILVSVFPRFKC